MRDRFLAYLITFGLIGAGAAEAVLAAISVDRLNLQPSEFAASAAAVAVLALVYAIRPAEGIAAFLVFILFGNNWEYWFGPDLRLSDEGTVVAFLAVGLARRYFVVDRLRFGPKEAGLALVLVAGVASSLVNEVPLAIWGPALILLFKAIVFFYLVSWLRITIDDVQRVSVVIGCVTLVVLGLGFVEFLDPARFQQLFGLPPLDQERGEITVVKSLFLHPSLFGWLAGFISVFLYARLFVLHSVWALPLALLATVGIVISGRRTPLIGLAVALIAAIVWQVRRWRSHPIALKPWVPMLAAVLALAVVFWPAFTRIYDYTIDEYIAPRRLIAEILSPDPNAEAIAAVQPRVALYVGSVAIARDYFPLGAGLGRYGSHMSRLEYSSVYGRYGLDQVVGLRPGETEAVTDTFWPMLLGEAGVIGLAAFALFIGALLVELWRISHTAGHPLLRSFGLGSLLLFVESIIGSATGATYAAPPIAYFVFAASGASLALVTGRGDPTASR